MTNFEVDLDFVSLTLSRQRDVSRPSRAMVTSIPMSSPAPDQLKHFEDAARKMAASIGAPAEYLPTFGYSRDGACPHIEYNSDQYHYVVIERGQELERISSPDPHEILYHVFQGVTFSMAVDYEIRHRQRGQDVRRILFAAQEELIGRLSTVWRDRLAREHETTLKKHPFNDHVR